MLLSLGIAFTDYLAETCDFIPNASNAGSIKSSYGGIYNLISSRRLLPYSEFHILCDNNLNFKLSSDDITFHTVYDKQPSAVIITESSKLIRSSIADIPFLDLSDYNFFAISKKSWTIAYIAYLDLVLLPPFPLTITTFVFDLCLNQDSMTGQNHEKSLVTIKNNIFSLLERNPSTLIYISVSLEVINPAFIEELISLSQYIFIIAHSPDKVDIIANNYYRSIANNYYLEKHSNVINGLGDIFTFVFANNILNEFTADTAVINSQKVTSDILASLN